MDMSEILAVAAFCIALATVFLVNDALRKVERKHDTALKNSYEKLKSDLDTNNQIVRELRDEVDEVKGDIKKNIQKSLEAKRQLSNLEDKLKNVSDDVAVLNGETPRKTPLQSV